MHFKHDTVYYQKRVKKIFLFLILSLVAGCDLNHEEHFTAENFMVFITS
jgi:hypothetical protein